MQPNWTADTAAGSARALAASVLRTLPRTPAIRFFAPKPKPNSTDIKGEYRDGRLRLRVGFMAASAGASTILFKTHTTFAGDSRAHTDNGKHLAVNFVGGAAGGAIHGAIMSFAPRPDVEPGCGSLALGARARSVPLAMLRESLGFGMFFAIHATLLARWRPAASAAAQECGSPLLSSSHLTDLGTSCAAGAVAGGGYHVATYPVLTAQTLAAPETGTAAVLSAARVHGLAVLYRGVLRTSASGLLSGAAAFGAYDTVLRCLDL